MPITTRLTERLGLATPILSAPMAFAGGGELAASVSAAGALGLIGGGYGDGDWLDAQFEAAGNQPVGCGFITWSLADQPALLDRVIAHAPKAVMLSFGDPAPFVPKVREAGAVAICQTQTMAHIRDALAAGADIVVAQGSEAGGHGAKRGTLSFVAEAVDHCRAESPGTLVLAAGGLADGRGLAAALMLGADGVLMGSRFWASREALVPQGFYDAALAADGDATVRTTLVDVIRRKQWPAEFDIRVLDNAFTRAWQGREDLLRDGLEEAEARYNAAAVAGDADNAGVIVGEATGLIRDIPSAGDLVARITAEAETLLKTGPGYCS
ncbi:MAG: nitronate monooxygenase [Alphaproteobacteria bacterium]|nr:nitronate monooxygenase [Alphaproteobacteria bacterium]